MTNRQTAAKLLFLRMMEITNELVGLTPQSVAIAKGVARVADKTAEDVRELALKCVDKWKAQLTKTMTPKAKKEKDEQKDKPVKIQDGEGTVGEGE